MARCHPRKAGATALAIARPRWVATPALGAIQEPGQRNVLASLAFLRHPRSPRRLSATIRAGYTHYSIPTLVCGALAIGGAVIKLWGAMKDRGADTAPLTAGLHNTELERKKPFNRVAAVSQPRSAAGGLPRAVCRGRSAAGGVGCIFCGSCAKSADKTEVRTPRLQFSMVFRALIRYYGRGF